MGRMTLPLVAAVGVAAGVALALPPRLRAQQDSAAATGPALAADPALAKQGERLFVDKGCKACHTIGKGKGAGPDLAGVLERRSVDWVKRWVKAPDQMMQSDSTAQALVAAYNNTKMPNLKLSDKEVDALVHYIARESAKHAKS